MDENTYIPLDMLLSAAIGKWLIFMRMRNLSLFAESAVQSRFAMFGNQRRKCLGCGNCNGRRGYARPSDMKQCSIESSFCQNILGLLD